MQAVLYYAHDPMCSWCWGFAPVLDELTRNLPGTVTMRRLLGGLAEDTDEPMPEEQQARIRATWQRIETTIPGIHFNHDFWTQCQPRRSTWAACRAVIAARDQGAQYDKRMTTAIQHAYYLQARNPSDTATLLELAQETGLDCAAFAADLDAAGTVQQLEREMQHCERLRATSFPALILEQDDARWPIPVDYHDSMNMLSLIKDLLALEDY